NPNDQVVKIKALEAFQAAADGKATKEVTVELTIKDATKKILVDGDGNEYTVAALDAANTSKALAEALNKNE
ncbi:hypothetical protein DK853_50400, partial [Klebsiella oxytoca]